MNTELYQEPFWIYGISPAEYCILHAVADVDLSLDQIVPKALELVERVLLIPEKITNEEFQVALESLMKRRFIRIWKSGYVHTTPVGQHYFEAMREHWMNSGFYE